jgi:hypothetical protein
MGAILGGPKDKDASSSLTLDQSKARIEDLRASISGLKKRHARSIELKAATSSTARAIQRSQAEVCRLRRRYPALAASPLDTYSP